MYILCIFYFVYISAACSSSSRNLGRKFEIPLKSFIFFLVLKKQQWDKNNLIQKLHWAKVIYTIRDCDLLLRIFNKVILLLSLHSGHTLTLTVVTYFPDLILVNIINKFYCTTLDFSKVHYISKGIFLHLKNHHSKYVNSKCLLIQFTFPPSPMHTHLYICLLSGAKPVSIPLLQGKM